MIGSSRDSVKDQQQQRRSDERQEARLRARDTGIISLVLERQWAAVVILHARCVHLLRRYDQILVMIRRVCRVAHLPRSVRRLLRLHRRCRRDCRSRWFGRGRWWYSGRHHAVIAQKVDGPKFWHDVEQGLLLSSAADHARHRRAVLVVRDQRRGVRYFHVRVICLQCHVHTRAGLQEDYHAVTDTRQILFSNLI